MFCKWIEARLSVRGMTQTEVAAAMARIGAPVHASTVNRWVSGERIPRLAQMSPLLDVLDVTPVDRLGVYELASRDALAMHG